MKGTQKAILIVDDEARIVRVLADYLTASGYAVFEAFDGEEALDVFAAHNTEIDLILLDVMMPKLDGTEVLEEIRKTSLVPVIFLTAKGTEYDQIRGFQSGADDYMVKPFSQSVLVLRIEAIMNRVGKSNQQSIEVGALSLNQTSRTALLGEKVLELTRREFDLLAFFMLHVGQILSREQLLNGVWGYDFTGELRTVDTHVKQLRSKFGKENPLVKTVFGIGYRMEVPE
ncbi:MAG: response regulator transcription factor [Eubacteriales bacterium]